MKHFALIPLAFLVFITGCTSGSHKVTGTLREPVPPEAVKIYAAMPPHAEVIGLVSADSFGGTTLQDANQDALQKLRIEAGRLGANAIVIDGGNDKPLDGAQIKAKAIYIAP
jgi:hypothetical protein